MSAFALPVGVAIPMDSDRKYRQTGYMDSDRPERGPREERKPGPRLPIDVTGPRLPRLVQAVAAARCYNCSTALPAGHGFQRELSEMQRSAALLQAMLAFRALHPIPVPEADSGADTLQGQGQRVHAVLAARHGGAGWYGRGGAAAAPWRRRAVLPTPARPSTGCSRSSRRAELTAVAPRNTRSGWVRPASTVGRSILSDEAGGR